MYVQEACKPCLIATQSQASLKGKARPGLTHHVLPVNRPTLPGQRAFRETWISPTRRQASAITAVTMSDQRVEFQNDDKIVLVGILVDAGSKDAVVMCHGFASNKNGFHLPAIAEALAEKGISSLRIDMRGNGESGGPFKYANYIEEADDMVAAGRFLESVGKKTLGLVGHSKAGSAALICSAKHPEIPRIANVSGRFDHKRGVARRFGEDVFEVVEKNGSKKVTLKMGGKEKEHILQKEDLDERMTTDMDAVCRQIDPKTRVLTIHGSLDETIPVEDAHNFAARLPGKYLHVVEGADHKYTKPEHAEELIAKLVEFFTQ